MTIKHTFDASGGFVVGDTTSGLTAYAFPSSSHANLAKRDPDKVARQMIASESMACRVLADVKTTDARHWATINNA